MAKKRLKKGRLFLTLALIAGTIVGADAIRRDYFVHPDNTIVVDGDFRDPQTPAPSGNNNVPVFNSTTQPASQQTTGISYLGYSELSIPSSQLSSGMLSLIDQTHPAQNAAQDGLIALADVKNDCYSLRSDELLLDENAAEALNRMMLDYNANTGLSDFIIYNTTLAYTGEDSVCTLAFPESVTGYTVDLAVQGTSRILAYDGKDEEAWVAENCADYGFIIRYPQGKENVTGQSSCVWHLRYVGTLHSSIMRDNNLCFEEYLTWLKSYSVTAPYLYQLDGTTYEVYYAGSMGDSTPVRIPVSGNYTISGNNADGYIIAAVK